MNRAANFDQGYAIVVGVGADLPNTVDDAIGIAGILKDPARCAYPPGQVHTLTGERATRDNIFSTFDTLSQSTNPQSTNRVCRVLHETPFHPVRYGDDKSLSQNHLHTSAQRSKRNDPELAS